MKKIKLDKNQTSSALMIIGIIVIIILSILFAQYRNGMTLVQLHDNSSRQMMGYILETKNNTIVIDGGLKEDAQNLIDNINSHGAKVNAWFLTHPHMDHVQAFMEVVKTQT